MDINDVAGLTLSRLLIPFIPCLFFILKYIFVFFFLYYVIMLTK